MVYFPLNNSGSFEKATHIRSYKAKSKRPRTGTLNKIEDMLGLITALYSEKVYNFTELRFDEYERKLRKAILKEKIGNTLIISRSKNMKPIILNISIVIKSFLPFIDIDDILKSVEKEINKMEVTE